MGYRPYVFCTRVSKSSEVVCGGSFDGGTSVVVTRPISAIDDTSDDDSMVEWSRDDEVDDDDEEVEDDVVRWTAKASAVEVRVKIATRTEAF